MTDDMQEIAARMVADVVGNAASSGASANELKALAVSAAAACVAGFEVLTTRVGSPAEPFEKCLSMRVLSQPKAIRIPCSRYPRCDCKVPELDEPAQFRFARECDGQPLPQPLGVEPV